MSDPNKEQSNLPAVPLEGPAVSESLRNKDLGDKMTPAEQAEALKASKNAADDILQMAATLPPDQRKSLFDRLSDSMKSGIKAVTEPKENGFVAINMKAAKFMTELEIGNMLMNRAYNVVCEHMPTFFKGYIEHKYGKLVFKLALGEGLAAFLHFVIRPKVEGKRWEPYVNFGVSALVLSAQHEVAAVLNIDSFLDKLFGKDLVEAIDEHLLQRKAA